jgi:hypothetical protein
LDVVAAGCDCRQRVGKRGLHAVISYSDSLLYLQCSG